MLTAYDIRLATEGSRPVSNTWAYPLYAALLAQADFEVGEATHSGGRSPVSQYIDFRDGGPCWHIHLLGEACEKQLAPVIERTSDLSLRSIPCRVRLSIENCQTIRGPEELLTMGEAHNGMHRLLFASPTAFKRRGSYLTLPDPRLITQSLIRQWNACLAECPIDDENDEGMEAIAEGLRFGEFHLDSARFHLKGQFIPGFTGSLSIQNHLSGFHRTLGNALLLFAHYSGIGIKTTLGMGGVRHLSFPHERSKRTG